MISLRRRRPQPDVLLVHLILTAQNTTVSKLADNVRRSPGAGGGSGKGAESGLEVTGSVCRAKFQREGSDDQSLFSQVYFRTLRRRRPGLTCVAIVTALIQAACDFREPIVTDVFQRKALVGLFFQLCNSHKIRKWVCHKRKIQ